MSDHSRESASESSSSRWKRAGTVLAAVFLLAAVGGLMYVWSIDPVWGRGMQIITTYCVVVLSALVVLVWTALFFSFRWKTILASLAALLLLAVGAAASVRSVEFNGDMQLIVNYRWDPTQEELIRRHRASQTPPDAILNADISVPPLTPEDAPAYRGADRDGVIVGPPLKQDWTSDPPQELWRQPCGGGYASFAVLHPFLVTLEQRGEFETVVCYDADSGYERWTYHYPAAFTEVMGGPGPRATPTIDNGTVFSFGALGDLVALDLVTGELRWSQDLLPEGLPVPHWGLSSSPLVIGEQVIVEVGGPEGDGLVSVHRDTGDLLWQRPGVERLSEPGAENRAGYSSPVVETIDGVRQLLIFDGEGVRSHVPETGEQLWFHPFSNDPGVSVAQPVVWEDGRIFLAMSYGVGCEMIRVARNESGWQPPEVLWKNLNMKCKFTSPVLHEGFLYGLDEGVLVCLDPETGKRQWKGGKEGTRGRFYHGQILLTNGQILGFTERGDLVLVDANPQAYRELAALPVFDSRKVWNPLALSRGRVYLRSHEQMAAYDLRAAP